MSGAQLALFAKPSPAPERVEGDLAVVEWWTHPPARHGMYKYVVMVRGPHDPSRRPRPKGGVKDKAPHQTLKKTLPADWAERIAAHIADGLPRTMNAISVEMLDLTADIVHGNFEDGLWLLVADGRAEYTAQAPIYFRAVVAA